MTWHPVYVNTSSFQIHHHSVNQPAVKYVVYRIVYYYYYWLSPFMYVEDLTDCGSQVKSLCQCILNLCFDIPTLYSSVP